MSGCWLVDLALNHLSCLKKRRSWSERERKHTVRGQRSPRSDEWLNVHWLWASDGSVLFHIPLPKAVLHKTVAAAHLKQFHNVLHKWVNHTTRAVAWIWPASRLKSCFRVSLVPRSLLSYEAALAQHLFKPISCVWQACHAEGSLSFSVQ